MKVKRIGITEILRRIWLFSANEIKSSESFSKLPTQLIVELNSSLRHIIVTNLESYESVDIIDKSNENLDGPEDKFGFNKTLWTPEESSRANGKKLKWLLVSTSLKSHVS